MNSDCIEHLFKELQATIHSLGETEILGQLKDAYQCAVGAKSTGKALNKLFQKAFHVAKHIRSNTGIQRGSTSVGSVAVELAERIFDGLEGKRVMVIGAGDTSEKTARSLLSRGASELLVTNRSIERARALADELDGRAVAFEDWQEEFHHLDIVIQHLCPHLRPQSTQGSDAPLESSERAVFSLVSPAPITITRFPSRPSKILSASSTATEPTEVLPR